jgi:putative PIN family toxin of toxin-antitoxin system
VSRSTFKCHVCGGEAARNEFVNEVLEVDGRRVLVEHILLVDVIMRPEFVHYLDEERRSRFLFVLAQVSEVIGVQTRVTECSDPKDNEFLELAIDGNAQLIVSGDSHLRDLHPFRGFAIVTPGEFLAENRIQK